MKDPNADVELAKGRAEELTDELRVPVLMKGLQRGDDAVATASRPQVPADAREEIVEGSDDTVDWMGGVEGADGILRLSQPPAFCRDRGAAQGNLVVCEADEIRADLVGDDDLDSKSYKRLDQALAFLEWSQ